MLKPHHLLILVRHVADLQFRHVVVHFRCFDVSQDVLMVGLYDLVVVSFDVLFE